jgi:hypothetical protein
MAHIGISELILLCILVGIAAVFGCVLGIAAFFKINRIEKSLKDKNLL